jgi:hypothetical protein
MSWLAETTLTAYHYMTLSSLVKGFIKQGLGFAFLVSLRNKKVIDSIEVKLFFYF